MSAPSSSSVQPTSGGIAAVTVVEPVTVVEERAALDPSSSSSRASVEGTALSRRSSATDVLGSGAGQVRAGADSAGQDGDGHAHDLLWTQLRRGICPASVALITPRVSSEGSS